jgi:integrase
LGYVEKQRGKYRARYRDPSGRITSRTFPRKADAERFVREMEVDISRGAWVDPRDAEMSLADWADKFLALTRRHAPKTQETYARDLGRYVLPQFGRHRIGRVQSEEIENWLNDELEAGLAPSSVHRHYRTLRRVLQSAVEKRKLIANPCDSVNPPRVPHREMLFLSWAQVVALAEAHDARYRALIYLAVDSGMRWSELVGLRRARVDLLHGKVRVTEQLVQLQDHDWLRSPPKTAADVRSITISPVTAPTVADHLDRFAAPTVDGLVFVNRAGNPLISSSFRTHYFMRAQEQSGVACRFHDLRHTSVALAIAEGAHPKAIQARMGHSSINVTLDRYGHLFPELDEAIASSFGERLAEARAAHTG